MIHCNICGSDDDVAHNGREYLCLVCEASIEETLGELNEIEDDIDADEEFWAEVLADEMDEWVP